MTTAQLTPLVLWRDDDEDPTSEIIRLDGVIFDTTGSSTPTLILYTKRPQSAADVIPAISSIAAASAGLNLVTFASAHGLAPGDVITFAGFTPSGYNASWTVASVPTSTTANIPANLAAATVIGGNANVVTTLTGAYTGDTTTGFRATWAIPRATLASHQPSWWHRAYLTTATPKRKTFSRGPVEVRAQ